MQSWWTYLAAYLAKPPYEDNDESELPTEQGPGPPVDVNHDPEQWLPNPEIENILARLCTLPLPDTQGIRDKLPAQRFERISGLLQLLDKRNGRSHREPWESRPRIYTILRNINALPCMVEFVRHAYCDISLPFNNETLPRFLTNQQLRSRFLECQKCVLTDARLLEPNPDADHGDHIHFEVSADEHIRQSRILGKGGYGCVDEVLSKLSLKKYARKRIHRGKDAESSQRRQQYLVKEISLMKKLSHRHLTKIVGSYTDPQYIAYLMEPIAECNLKDFLERPTLTPSDIISVRQFFGCLAAAVNYLHKNHIRHRDLKPQNILIKSSQVYIADFGAAMMWTSARRGTTQDRHAPKTEFYMAPEIDARAPRNASSDMWSLGIVFLEMLTVVRGMSLRKWRSHLSREAHLAKREDFPCRNISALNDWLQILGSSPQGQDMDSEPLVWTKSLLVSKPEQRPFAQSLVRSILDSGYFHEYCCYDCSQEYQDTMYFYEQRQHEELTEQHQSSDIPPASRPETGTEPGRTDSSTPAISKQDIEDWFLGTRSQSPLFNIEESHTAARFDQHDAHAEVDIAQSDRLPAVDLTEEEPRRHNNRRMHRHGFFFVEDDTDSSSSKTDRPPERCQFSEHEERNIARQPFRIVEDASSASDDGVSFDGDRPLIREAIDIASIAERRNTGVELSPTTATKGFPIVNPYERAWRMGRHDEVAGNSAPHYTTSHSSRSTKRPIIHHNNAFVPRHTENKVVADSLKRRADKPTHLPVHSEADLKTSSERKIGKRAHLSPDMPEKDCQEIMSEEHREFASMDHPTVETQDWRKPGDGLQRQHEERNRIQGLVSSSGIQAAAKHAATSPQPKQANTSAHALDTESIVAPLANKDDGSIRLKAPKPLSGDSLTHESRESLDEQRSDVLSRREVILDGDTFSPSQYIEDVWRRMAERGPTSSPKNHDHPHGKLRWNLYTNSTLLEKSCKDGDAKEVRKLLKKGWNPGTHDKSGPKPLLLSIKGGSAKHNKCVKLLIAYGCDVNARFRKRTPIHWAVDRSYFPEHGRLICMLLRAGADMNQPDGDGEYPLLKILAGGGDETLQPHQIVALAVALHSEVPKQVDINVRQPVSSNTALHLAIQRRSSEAVAMLIHAGADVNARNSSGTTPLLMMANQWRGLLVSDTAMPHQQEMSLVYLTDAPELDVDIVGGSLERGALHLAAAAGYATGVELLLSRSADCQLKDKDGKTPLDALEGSKENMSEVAFHEIYRMLKGGS